MRQSFRRFFKTRQYNAGFLLSVSTATTSTTEKYHFSAPSSQTIRSLLSPNKCIFSVSDITLLRFLQIFESFLVPVKNGCYMWFRKRFRHTAYPPSSAAKAGNPLLYIFPVISRVSFFDCISRNKSRKDLAFTSISVFRVMSICTIRPGTV